MGDRTRSNAYRRDIFYRTTRTKKYRITIAFTVFVLVAVWIVSPFLRPQFSRTLTVEEGIQLAGGRYPEPKFYDDEANPPDWTYREQAVKRAFLHAYQAYEDNAFGADEYLPISMQPRYNFNGWGVSIVDAMDTMYLMGHKLAFERALVHVSTMTFDLPEDQSAHFFETTIRYLGGLLSAFALSNEPILLEKADELGHKLLSVFDTPSGIPTYGVNTQSGKKDGGIGHPRVLLAEISSCQLEYRYLAHLTGKTEYFQAVERINSVLQMSQNLRPDSLWATHWETVNATQLNNHFSIGAWSDSAYEYILKQYLQTSKSEARFKRMYVRAIRGLIEKLVYLSPHRKLLYVTDVWGAIPTHKLEQFSCFFPGLLALGVHSLTVDSSFSERDKSLHTWVAEGLAHTCWLLYGESETGLGPEETQFSAVYAVGNSKEKIPVERWISHVLDWEQAGSPNNKPPGVGSLASLVKNSPGNKQDYLVRTPPYLLRPETIESIYFMWKTTGDNIWRERGWSIFSAIEQHCRLHVGYASVANVTFTNPLSLHNKLDDMPSYALAETWKYLYLLFISDDPLPLDKWVFNTEAHPLPVFTWNEAERKKYRIF